MANTLLAVKRQLRRTRPHFVRHANHRKASLNDHWRKPRGLHNKQKDHKKGSFPGVSDGYRTPKAVRGMHISGFEIVSVANVSQLAGVNPKTQAIVILRTGAAKQLAILRAAGEKKIKVLNFKAESRIKAIEDKHSAAKKASEEAKKAKAAKEEKAKKETKKPIEEKLSEEEKKEQQDKLKEEVLTGKES